jgi:hypothetical protein
MNFKVGDSIIVKPGVQDPDLGIGLGGWQGRISEVFKDDNLVCIDWDSLTLKGISEEIIAQCEEDGLEWRQMYLETTEVELATARDTEADVAQLSSQIQSQHAWEHLGEEGRRIQQILAHVDPDDERAILAAWNLHLKKTLRSPFEAEVSELQESGRLRIGDQVIVKKIVGIDDLYGILVEIKGKHGVSVFPLCDLAMPKTSSPNNEHLQIYSLWFSNH